MKISVNDGASLIKICYILKDWIKRVMQKKINIISLQSQEISSMENIYKELKKMHQNVIQKSQPALCRQKYCLTLLQQQERRACAGKILSNPSRPVSYYFTLKEGNEEPLKAFEFIQPYSQRIVDLNIMNDQAKISSNLYTCLKKLFPCFVFFLLLFVWSLLLFSVLVCFLRQGFSVQFWLFWHSLYRLGRC